MGNGICEKKFTKNVPLAAANLYFGYPSNRLMKSAGREEEDEIGLDVEGGQPTFGSRQQPKFVRHFTMSTNSEGEIEIGG